MIVAISPIRPDAAIRGSAPSGRHGRSASRSRSRRTGNNAAPGAAPIRANYGPRSKAIHRIGPRPKIEGNGHVLPMRPGSSGTGERRLFVLWGVVLPFGTSSPDPKAAVGLIPAPTPRTPESFASLWRTRPGPAPASPEWIQCRAVRSY